MISKLQNGVTKTKHRFSSMNLNRRSTASSSNAHPTEHLRSTHSSSSTSTYSSGKNEIVGYFSDDKQVDSFKIAPNSIILSRIKSDGSYKVMVTQKMDTTPSFMSLVTDKMGKPHLVVFENELNKLTIFKTVKTVKTEIIPIHNEKIEVGNAITRVVAAYEVSNALLAMQISRKCILLISFSGEKPIVYKRTCEEYTPQCLGWLYDKDSNLKVISEKIAWDKIHKKIQFDECNVDPKEFKLSEERKEITKKLHSGHLVMIPAPLDGVLILGQSFITYFNESDPVTRQICQQKKLQYTCFALLGNNKVVYVDHDNVMYMSRLVVNEQLPTTVLSIDTHIIEKDRMIKNIYATDEFSLMMQMEDDTWKFGYVTRARPGIKYTLEIEDEMRPKDQDQVASPPLRARLLGEPVAVQKAGRPETSDILNDKWSVMKKLGSGSYGTVHFVKEKKKKDVFVLKSQRISSNDTSIINELNFLRKLKSFDDNSGFPSLIDDFILYEKWQLMIISNEGHSLIQMLNKNSSVRFSEENIFRIGYQATTILLKMHKHGFVHRDFHEGNVLVKLSSKKTIALAVIDFGFTMLEKDTKAQDFMATPYASLNVCEGKRSVKKDDLFSMHCVLLKCGGNSEMFNIENKEQLIKKKQQFDADPSQYFNEQQKWMGILYNIIKNIPSDDKEPAKTLLQYYEKGMIMENVCPKTEIEYTPTTGADFMIN